MMVVFNISRELHMLCVHCCVHTIRIPLPEMVVSYSQDKDVLNVLYMHYILIVYITLILYKPVLLLQNTSEYKNNY